MRSRRKRKHGLLSGRRERNSAASQVRDGSTAHDFDGNDGDDDDGDDDEDDDDGAVEAPWASSSAHPAASRARDRSTKGRWCEMNACFALQNVPS